MHRQTFTTLVLVTLLVTATGTLAIEPSPPPSELRGLELLAPELSFGNQLVPLDQIRNQLENRRDWDDFQAQHPDVDVFIDRRSGVAASLIGGLPLVPGNGQGNALTFDILSTTLNRPLEQVDADAVAEAVRAFVAENQRAFGLDPEELGEIRATTVGDDLWQISAPRLVDGIPVRWSRLAATVKQGNLILLGGETWGPVRGSTQPVLSPDDALDRGFDYVGGRDARDAILDEPSLELVPVSPNPPGTEFDGPPGQGYRHRLLWVWSFQRGDEIARWEVSVDAHNGEIVVFQDKNHYATGQVKGAVYPLTTTDLCPAGPHSLLDPGRCGIQQSNYPMPWADDGQAPPDDFTNGAGLFNFTAAPTATTLTGLFSSITDQCGVLSESSASSILNLGGAPGEHNCTVPAGAASLGNTSAARTSFYHVSKINEIARGWLPGNPWLQTSLTTSTNNGFQCNAFYTGSSIVFAQDLGGCHNTGEIEAVIDHEWGHALDDNDANGTLSNTSEAYADLAAILRQQDSCVGYGFWKTSQGCGATADGTGWNGDEGQVAPHCITECSGVRDADFMKHVDLTPDTPTNFVCPLCFSSSGPCGRQVHCAAAPIRQAAWDLATRDLTSAPFYMDTNQAFITANKLFYQGSGNVSLWYSCDCAAGTSDGCGAAGGYLQWLAADDDNGNLGDGTPHMTAIHAAFDRHGIACGTPAPFDNGCFGAPTAAPRVTVNASPTSIGLTWTAVTGATEYWVLKSEGPFGCESGKALIATVAGTSYTDTEVLPTRQYCYTIVPKDANDACFGRASTCACTRTSRVCSNTKLLLNETFFAGIPASWTVVDGGGGGGASATWNTANPCGLAPGSPIAPPWAEVHSQCAGLGATQNEELITPLLDPSSCRGRVILEFDHQFAWNAAGQHEILDVDASTATSLAPWINTLRIENTSDGLPTPVRRRVDLTPQVKGQQFQLRFHYYDGSGDGWWALDNVRVFCECPPIISPCLVAGAGDLAVQPCPIPKEEEIE